MAISSSSSIGAIVYRNSSLFKEKEYRQNSMIDSPYSEKQQEHAQRINKMKRMIKGAEKNQNAPKSILDQTLSYGESIRASRNKSKDTASQIKKLRYNFKEISGQIRKSKTSVSAKQVASKARREVLQLKMKLQTGKYDKEELEAAITHAKEMERAAKKKARHLEEEELIKITDESSGKGLVTSELEDKLEKKTEDAIKEYEEELDSQKENQEAIEELTEEQMMEMQELQEEFTDSMEDLMLDMMEDMAEETLGKLMDGMMTVTDFEMSEDEYKAFKQKHRTSEDKDMLEADAKYLKAMFDMYDRKMSAGSIASGVFGNTPEVTFSTPQVDATQNMVDFFV